MTSKNSNFLGCRVNSERYQEVKALCEEQGRTVNDFLGEIISNELNSSPDEAIENEVLYLSETSENQVVSESENNVSPCEPEEQDEEEPEKSDNSILKHIICYSLGFISCAYYVVNGGDLSALGIKGRFIKGSSGVSGEF